MGNKLSDLGVFQWEMMIVWTLGETVGSQRSKWSQNVFDTDTIGIGGELDEGSKEGKDTKDESPSFGLTKQEDGETTYGGGEHLRKRTVSQSWRVHHSIKGRHQAESWIYHSWA